MGKSSMGGFGRFNESRADAPTSQSIRETLVVGPQQINAVPEDMGFWKFLAYTLLAGSLGATGYVVHMVVTATSVTRKEGYSRAPITCPCDPDSVKSGVHKRSDALWLTPFVGASPEVRAGEQDRVNELLESWDAVELAGDFVNGARLVKGWVPLYGALLSKKCCMDYTPEVEPYVLLGRTCDWYYYVRAPSDLESTPTIMATRVVHCCVAPPTGLFVPGSHSTLGALEHPGHYTVEITGVKKTYWGLPMTAPGVIKSIDYKDQPRHNSPLKSLKDRRAVVWGHVPVFTATPTPTANRAEWPPFSPLVYQSGEVGSLSLVMGRVPVLGLFAPGMPIDTLKMEDDSIVTVAVGMARTSPLEVEVAMCCCAQVAKTASSVPLVFMTGLITPDSPVDANPGLKALAKELFEVGRAAKPLATSFTLCLKHLMVRIRGTVVDPKYRSGCKCLDLPGRTIVLGSCIPEQRLAPTWFEGVSVVFDSPVVVLPDPSAKLRERKRVDPPKVPAGAHDGDVAKGTAGPSAGETPLALEPPGANKEVEEAKTKVPAESLEWVSMPTDGLRCGLYALLAVCAASGMPRSLVEAQIPAATASIISVITAAPDEATDVDSLFSADRLIGMGRQLGIDVDVAWGPNFSKLLKGEPFKTSYKGHMRLDGQGVGHYHAYCNPQVVPFVLLAVDAFMPAITEAIESMKQAHPKSTDLGWTKILGWTFTSTAKIDPTVDTSRENCEKVLSANTLIRLFRNDATDEQILGYYFERDVSDAITASREISWYMRDLPPRTLIKVLGGDKARRLVQAISGLEIGPQRTAFANTIVKAAGALKNASVGL
jgi:hypothetical protein